MSVPHGSAFALRLAPAGATSAADWPADPDNPFCARAYAYARELLGNEPLLAWWTEPGVGERAVPLFLDRGRLRATLELPSFPRTAAPAAFVSALANAARRLGVGTLDINSFASDAFALPPLPGERGRVLRQEFVMDLGIEDLTRSLTASHRHRVRQARKAGVVLRRGADAEACWSHATLMAASMARRSARGEQVSVEVARSPTRELVESGAGEIFQAVREGEVLSSMLVLRAPRAGYDHSSGSSPAGMACGSSQFLILETGLLLREEGATVLNLGGARPEEEGLRSFKSHFGASTVDLQAVSLDTAGWLQQGVAQGARAVRGLLQRFRGTPAAL